MTAFHCVSEKKFSKAPKEITKTFLALICSLAVVCTVRGDTQQKQTSHSSKGPASHGGHASSGNRSPQGAHPSQHGAGSKHTTPGASKNAAPGGIKNVVPSPAPSSRAPAVRAHPPQGVRGPAGPIPVQPAPPPRPRTAQEINEDYAHSQGFRSFDQYQNWKQSGRIEGPSGVVKPWHMQHFDVVIVPDPTVEGVKFQGTGRIDGSDAWTGEKYAAFRDYHHEWHDKDWWEHHRPNDPAPSASPKSSYTPKPSSSPKPSASPKPSPNPKPSRPPSPTPTATPSATPTPPLTSFVLASGGWYFRNGCYWYPAWGYDPNHSYYAYDGPIYSCVWPPDQMVANVQARLKELGYYDGPINGLLGPATRTAIANYQYDRGLSITSAIDEVTMVSLGMA